MEKCYSIIEIFIRYLKFNLSASVLTIGILGITLAPKSASAVISSYTYNSTVDATPIGLGFSEPIDITYGFDPLVSDSNGNPRLGQYVLDSLDITIDGETTSLTHPGYPQGLIQMGDDNALDTYGVVAVNNSPNFSGSINGFELERFAFSLSNLSTTDWSDDSLITSTTLINSIERSSLSLFFTDSDSNTFTVRHPGQFGGEFTTTPFTVSDNSVQTVPFGVSPTSGWMIIAGIYGIKRLRRNQQKTVEAS